MKKRLDMLLVEQGLAESREKAKRLIMAGLVYQDTLRLDKASITLDEAVSLTVKGHDIPYVSRGGLKLEKALRCFPGLRVTGCQMIDVGASTGGFTDCMLQNGAAHVHAVDVGYGQLDWKLRKDPRVTVMERCNARNISPDMFPQPFDGASMDVSFISITKILPALVPCLAEHGFLVALIKPQFEAGREQVGKNGVVRDHRVHQSVLANTLGYVRDQTCMGIHGLDISPIKGPEGNIEFLLYAIKNEPGWDDAAVAARITEVMNEVEKM